VLVVKQQHRLPTVAVESPSMGIFKPCLDTVLLGWTISRGPSSPQPFWDSKKLLSVFHCDKNFRDLKNTAALQLTLFIKRTVTPITVCKNLKMAVVISSILSLSISSRTAAKLLTHH